MSCEVRLPLVQVMKPEIFATVMDFFNSGLPVVHEGADISGDTEIYDDDDDTVQMIKVRFFSFKMSCTCDVFHNTGAPGHPNPTYSAGGWRRYCLYGF